MTTFDETKHPRAAGGQFRETLHAEPSVSLAQPAPSAFTESERLIRNKMQAVRQAEKELDDVLILGALITARKVVPGATELRLSWENYNRKGMNVPRSIRAANGELIPAGYGKAGDWNFASPDPAAGAQTVTTLITSITHQEELFEEHPRFSFDSETDEWVFNLGSATTDEGN